jgi:hypothetical protein
VLLSRIAATGSVGCLAAHVALLALTGGSLLSLTLPMLALSVLCAGCAVRSWWRGCTGPELVVMLCSGSAMLAAHLLLAPMHDPSVRQVPVSTTADLLMHGGLTLALAVELVAGAELARRLLTEGFPYARLTFSRFTAGGRVPRFDGTYEPRERS